MEEENMVDFSNISILELELEILIILPKSSVKNVQ